VEQTAIFQFLPDLEKYHNDPDRHPVAEGKSLQHLSLLVDYTRKTYATTRNRLSELLKKGEIMYDLLWALFKPNTSVFTTCLGSEQPRCVEYLSGEEQQTSSGQRYFQLECRYLDFDGRVFGESATQLGIAKFRGVKRIDTLEAFPLEHHPSRIEMTKQLVACGRKFISLIGMHHRQYQGVAFYMKNERIIKVHVNSRIMIDPEIFRELHPSYSRPKIYTPCRSSTIDPYDFDDSPKKSADQVRDNGMDPSEMRDEDLLHCSPTIPGWVLSDKIWGEIPGRYLDSL
jgi:hypothetical protein